MATVIAIEHWWYRRAPRIRLALCYLPLVIVLALGYVSHDPPIAVVIILVSGSMTIVNYGVRALFREDFDSTQVDMVTLAGGLAGVLTFVPSGSLFIAVSFGCAFALLSRVAATQSLRQRYQTLPPPPR